MGINYNRTISLLWTFLLLANLDKKTQRYVEGVRTFDKSIFGPKPKGTIKTIEALDFGDIIDCVDIYKQPAFDNPLINELKMAPSSYERYTDALNETSNPHPKLMQTWTKYGECSKGTIPIRRTLNNNVTIHRKYDKRIHEYATAFQRFKYYFKSNGGKANFNVWNPKVEKTKEFSLSQMWATVGTGMELSSVEAGWMVYPSLFHDSRTRLFIYWSRDNYAKGCHNLICSGFVQTNKNVALGTALEPVSIYDGQSTQLSISLTRTRDVGDWWLTVNNVLVGYFPRQILNTLGDGADLIAFGGEAINLGLGSRHTTTQMGSGRFSVEGHLKASYVSNIRVMNYKFGWDEPELDVQAISRPTCYDLTFGHPGTHLGSHFFFGGPGFSERCK